LAAIGEYPLVGKRRQGRNVPRKDKGAEIGLHRSANENLAHDRPWGKKYLKTSSTFPQVVVTGHGSFATMHKADVHFLQHVFCNAGKHPLS